MSTRIVQTLIGTYEFYPDLFASLNLPTGFDKSAFIDALLLDQGEKSVLYSNPVYMAYSIGKWGAKWYHEFERIKEAIEEEYNPLHNFDRHEEYNDASNTNSLGTASDTLQHTRTSDEVTTLQHNRVSDDVTTHDVSAFNSTGYQSDDRTTQSGGNYTDGTTQSGGNYTDGRSGNVTGQETVNTAHIGHLYGNIGVTKSQDMLRDEIEVRMRTNLYGIMARMFAEELLINIY